MGERPCRDGFVFSVKGPRFATNRRVLAEAGDSIKRFLDSGVLELATGSDRCCGNSRRPKSSMPRDFAKFLELLPAKPTAARLRHVVEVRHPSFRTPDFIALARTFGRRSCSPTTPNIRRSPTPPADFLYARLQKGKDTIPTAYPPGELDAWSHRFDSGRRAKRPAICRASRRRAHRRDPRRATYSPMSFTKAKSARRPAAMALIERLKKD